MEQDPREQALKAAIQEGIQSDVSDVSDKTVPDIMQAVEARLRADGRLGADAKGDRPPNEG